jgi:hypothetical protein
MEACREVFLNETNEHASLAVFPAAFTRKRKPIIVGVCWQSDPVFMVTQRLKNLDMEFPGIKFQNRDRPRNIKSPGLPGFFLLPLLTKDAATERSGKF